MNPLDREIPVDELKLKYEHRYQAQGMDIIDIFQREVWGDLKWKHASFSIWEVYLFDELRVRSGKSPGKVRGIIIRGGLEIIQHDVNEVRTKIKESRTNYRNSDEFNPETYHNIRGKLNLGYLYLPTNEGFPITEDTEGMTTEIAGDLSINLASLYRLCVAYVGITFIDIQEEAIVFFQENIKKFKYHLETINKT